MCLFSLLCLASFVLFVRSFFIYLVRYVWRSLLLALFIYVHLYLCSGLFISPFIYFLIYVYLPLCMY